MNAQISRILPSLPPHLVTSGPELARVGLSSIKSIPDKIDVLIPFATAKHHAMLMERRRQNRRPACLRAGSCHSRSQR